MSAPCQLESGPVVTKSSTELTTELNRKVQLQPCKHERTKNVQLSYSNQKLDDPLTELRQRLRDMVCALALGADSSLLDTHQQLKTATTARQPGSTPYQYCTMAKPLTTVLPRSPHPLLSSPSPLSRTPTTPLHQHYMMNHIILPEQWQCSLCLQAVTSQFRQVNRLCHVLAQKNCKV